MKSLLYGIFALGIFASSITKIYGYNEADIDQKAVSELRARIRKEKLVTYAMLHTNRPEFTLSMAAIADAISRSTCVKFLRSNDTSTADIVAETFIQNGGAHWCGFRFRGLANSGVGYPCVNAFRGLRLILQDHFQVNPQFFYPLYYDKREIKLYFLEIADLNDKFDCPCEDERTDCDDYEDACSIDGWMLGSCLKHCGVCPYYDLNIYNV